MARLSPRAPRPLAPALAILLAAAAPAAAAAGEPPIQNRLAQVAALEGPAPADGRSVRLPLPRAVLAATSRNMADLRLADDLGREVPFAIRVETASRTPERRHVFRATAYDPESQTLILGRDAGATGPYDRVDIRTGARNFRKNLTVSGSDDLEDWRELGRGAIFDFSARVDLRRTTLEIGRSQNRYLRLVWEDGAEDPSDAGFSLQFRDLSLTVGEPAAVFRVDGVEGWLSDAETVEATLDRMTVDRPAAARPDRDGITWIELGEVNLPLARVEWKIADPYFHRKVRVQAADQDKPEDFKTVATGTLYRFPGVSRDQTAFGCFSPQRRWLRFGVEDGDSPPLTVESVTLAWTRLNLYFVPEPGRSYALYCGGEGVAEPRYDVAALLPAGQAELRSLPGWSAGGLVPNPDYQPFRPPGVAGRIAFYSVLALMGAVLCLWLYRLAKNLPPPEAGPPAPPAA